MRLPTFVMGRNKHTVKHLASLLYFSFFPLPKYVSILMELQYVQWDQTSQKGNIHEPFSEPFLSRSRNVLSMCDFCVCVSLFTHLCNDTAMCEDRVWDSKMHMFGVQLLKKLFCQTLGRQERVVKKDIIVFSQQKMFSA